MNSRCSKHGLSLLEITIAVVVLATAMLPILLLTTTTARDTYSMEKHLVAGQFATGVMDRLLALPYAECQRAVAGEDWPKSVAADSQMQPFLGAGSGFADALRKSLREFTYEVALTEATGDEKGQMFTLQVIVKWPLDAAKKQMRQTMLQAVKFNENP
ncbi:MAG TPA: hypothetical protein PKO06_13770 [Candidatus Ozemobacteraceae bacterium]|nr:hypothetical protein [Candidatus Ozemobacteraceae bacterium]